MAPADLCVYCRQNPVELRWRPFCSERCRLLDLARWVDGEYRVPGEPVSPDTDAGDREPADDSSPAFHGRPGPRQP